MGQSEDDLLSCHDACGPPCWEGLLSRFGGCFELSIGRLRYSGDEIIGSGVVEVDPGGCLGRDKFVIDEVVGVNNIFDLFVGCRIVGHGSACSGKVLGCSVQSSLCDLLIGRHSEGGSRGENVGRSSG